jgi:hypothetical protein
MCSLTCSCICLQTRLKSSFYPLLNPITSPGTNPKPAAIGDPEVTIVEECVANCDAVLLSASTICPSILVNVVLVAFSISIHFTSIHPLYDRYARPATNNLTTTTAAIFMTFLIAYPATAPNRNPPPAEKRNSSTGKSEDALSSQNLYTQDKYTTVVKLVNRR